MSQLSYCQVLVGQSMAGLVGLQEIMGELASSDVPADAPGLGQTLVDEVRKHNYVPSRAEEDYKAALVREYRRFLEVQASGASGRVWRDPRKAHNWYPTILEAKCDGCGACLDVCARDVLGWNADNTRVVVLEPYECGDGCQLCARACTRGAIVMPPRESLHRNINVSEGRH